MFLHRTARAARRGEGASGHAAGRHRQRRRAVPRPHVHLSRFGSALPDRLLRRVRRRPGGDDRRDRPRRALDRAGVFARVVPPGAPPDGDYVLDGFVSALYGDVRESGEAGRRSRGHVLPVARRRRDGHAVVVEGIPAPRTGRVSRFPKAMRQRCRRRSARSMPSSRVTLLRSTWRRNSRRVAREHARGYVAVPSAAGGPAISILSGEAVFRWTSRCGNGIAIPASANARSIMCNRSDLIRRASLPGVMSTQ